MFCAADLNRCSGSVVRARLIAEGLSRCGGNVHVVAFGIPSHFPENEIRSTTVGPEDRWDEAVLSSMSSFRPDILLGITEVGTDVLADAGARFRCPVVFDLHGIGAIEIIELGREYGPRWGRLRDSCRWLSRIPGAAAITVANPTLFSILKPFNKRTIPFIGMTDVSLFCPEGPSVSLGRDRTKLQVLYAGNCFKWQGVDLLVEAMKILLRDREPMEFTLMGTARRDERVTTAWRAGLPLETVHFREAVDYSQVPGYVRGADILVIPRPFMLSTYLAFPQKLVDYMASGRVIVATNLAPHRFGLFSPPSGILCPPTVSGLVEGIRKAKTRPLREELSASARRKALDLFCHLRQTSRMYSLFGEIVRGGAG
ncbi:MAG TPA: glycosyltransferase [Candidatus Deferrimicrobiaceae bacterium]